MTVTGKILLLRVCGLVFYIVPPCIATINYFPLFAGEPKKQLSIVGVILLLIACIPLWKFIKKCLKSPSALKVWVALFVIFLLCEHISHEVVCISLVGVLSAIVGDALFLWAKSVGKKNGYKEAEEKA